MPEPVEAAATLLAGRVALVGSERGLKPTTDTVLLAASVAAAGEDRVLDAGCGSGGASLCLAARSPRCVITGLERDPALVLMARRNVRANGWDGRLCVEEGAVETFRASGTAFDIVMTNPPHLDPPCLAGAVGPGSLRRHGRNDAGGRLDRALPEASRAEGFDLPRSPARAPGRHPERPGRTGRSGGRHASPAPSRRIACRTDPRARHAGFAKAPEVASRHGPSRSGRTLHPAGNAHSSRRRGPSMGGMIYLSAGEVPQRERAGSVAPGPCRSKSSAAVRGRP